MVLIYDGGWGLWVGSWHVGVSGVCFHLGVHEPDVPNIARSVGGCSAAQWESAERPRLRLKLLAKLGLHEVQRAVRAAAARSAAVAPRGAAAVRAHQSRESGREEERERSHWTIPCGTSHLIVECGVRHLEVRGGGWVGRGSARGVRGVRRG